MAAGLVLVTQIQNLSKSQHHQNQQPTDPNSTPISSTSTWMWNPRDQQQHHQQQQDHQDQDDSWEVRAFAEDTSNIMGTTWPPRSYTCTFCRREFRSAQALGGHMNVHRRDRARLHQASSHNNSSNHNLISPLSLSQYPSNSFLQEPFANGGLCLLYPFPSPNSVPFANGHTTTLNNACGDSPSTIFSVSSHSQYPSNNLMRVPSCSPSSFVAQPVTGVNVFSSYSGKVEQEPTASSANRGHHEELDLELRLGNRSTST